MAKRRSNSSEGAGPKAPSSASNKGGRAREADEPPIRDAEDAVSRAREELEKARRWYEKVSSQTTDRIKAVRESTVDDLVRGTLRAVKKHPGPSVLVAAVIGFFLGRLFRR